STTSRRAATAGGRALRQCQTRVMRPGGFRAAVVWPGVPGTAATETPSYGRLVPVLTALADAGVDAEPVLYRDDAGGELVGRLATFDGVLVWVDPITVAGDRTVLDSVLRVVAAAGTWGSAHPDAILKLGTKEVLYRTRTLGGGMDTRLYAPIEDFREQFPAHLAAGRPRVVKQNRGNGGIGVWKVQLVDARRQVLRVQHAAPRDDVVEDVALDEFMERCLPYFAGGGKVVDQPFAERL